MDSNGCQLNVRWN